MRPFKLIEIEWPEFGRGERPPPIAADEFQQRLGRVAALMATRGFSHLVVYGDREHFANLTYLSGFDPRFEEALFIISPGRTPLLLVGNEGLGHVPVSPLHGSRAMRVECYQPFSLLNQDRTRSRTLKAILQGEGIGAGARVGCVGWKYFAEAEHETGVRALELPAFIVDTLRELAGAAHVENATALLMDPDSGLRATCSAAELAHFEFTNVLASESVRRVIFAARGGLTDYELARHAELNGEPLGAHFSMKTGATRNCALVSPGGATLRRGDPFSLGVCHWGANSCRAGWFVGEDAELPAEARGYVADFAGPYFSAVAEWMEGLRIGADAGKLTERLLRQLPLDRYGITLNPGHLIHLDEWLSSPFYEGSKSRLRSGMAIQTDIIPSSAAYFSTRVEDGVVLADAALRSEFQRRFPDAFARCEARRRFMRETLGIALAEEVLPLSNIAGLVPPFFLRPRSVFAVEQ